jgi:glycosyltransferase involved in cell wall biosynthesis
MDAPTVSIIVPVYNVEKYLEKCIDSILSQTFKDFELILVDDCSMDNSLKICKGFFQKDTRIKIITNSKNMGSSLSRKNGFEASSGKYIQFIDSDDWIESDMIERMAEEAEAENFDMVLCDFFDDQSKEIMKDSIIVKSEKIKDIITSFGTCAVWNKLVRREIVDKIIFPDTSYSEDRYITLQTIYFSNRFGYINLPLYHYVYNTNSITKKSVNEKQIMDLYDTYILILDFVKIKNIEHLEPELSNQINSIKLRILRDKSARGKCNIAKLPESNFHRWLLKETMKRIYKLIVPELFQITIRKIKRKIYCSSGHCT